MKILLASDHRGFEFKKCLLAALQTKFNIIDLGSSNSTAVDYPDYAHKLASELKEDDYGILICGSGIGMTMAANRHNNVRAFLGRSLKEAKLARQHNNANVIVFGADNMRLEKALKIINRFLNTQFEGGRHQRRINKINISK